MTSESATDGLSASPRRERGPGEAGVGGTTNPSASRVEPITGADLLLEILGRPLLERQRRLSDRHRFSLCDPTTDSNHWETRVFTDPGWDSESTGSTKSLRNAASPRLGVLGFGSCNVVFSASSISCCLYMRNHSFVPWPLDLFSRAVAPSSDTNGGFFLSTDQFQTSRRTVSSSTAQPFRPGRHLLSAAIGLGRLAPDALGGMS